jgi:predicted ATPase
MGSLRNEVEGTPKPKVLTDYAVSNRQLTIKKVSETIGIAGREYEIDILQSCLDRLTSEENDKKRWNKINRKELIFIRGQCGVGKSTLSNSLKGLIANTKNGIFASGKFEVNKRKKPYTGVSAVFGHICRTIKSAPAIEGEKVADIVRQIGEALLVELGCEVELLVRLIPELEGILPAAKRRGGVVAENFDFDTGRNRWKYALRVLTRVLSLHFSPLVLIFDDLQWADMSSLEFIDMIITSTQGLDGLMVVCCYRSDEVGENHVLSRKVNELTMKKEKCNYNATSLEVENMKAGDVNKVVQAMLSVDHDDVTRGLSAIVHRESHGNPFYLIEFMIMLEEKELVTFDSDILQWVWNEKIIESTIMSKATVLEMLRYRIGRLSEDAQLLSQYAACLGESFDTKILDLIWKQHAVHENSTTKKDNIVDLLAELEEGNLITSSGIRTYKWSHDKRHEAALSMEMSSNPSFRFEIGLFLYHSLGGEDLEENLFDVVNLINSISIRRRPEFATLNLRAANKARKISALHNASSYITHGIELLPNDKWVSRDLALQLYTIGAEVELALGNIGKMEKYSDKVLSRDDSSILDKMPLYMNKIYKLSTIDVEYDKTIEFCLSILKEVGFKLSPRSILPLSMQAFNSLSGAAKRARRMSSQDYSKLPTMTDPIQKAIMLVLYRLALAAYRSDNVDLLMIANARMVQMTFDYGVSDISGTSFGKLGDISILKNFEMTTYFGEIAMFIQSRARSKITEAKIVCHVNALVFPWTRTLQSCLKASSGAFISGMRSGNTEHACWALLFHRVEVPYAMGKSLHGILKNCQNDLARIEEVKMKDQAIVFRMFYQLILNLTGHSDNPLTLDGEIFSMHRFVSETGSLTILMDLMQLELCVLFGDFESAAELALECGDQYERAAPGYFLMMPETFYRGIALYAMARKSRKRIYKKHAKEIRKTIQKWDECGNPNVKHYHALLRAEQAVLDKEYSVADDCYKYAIGLATRAGYLHHVGLFNERYSDFLKKVMSDDLESEYRLDQAIKFYKEWGAKAKYERLEAEASMLMSEFNL